MDHLANLPQHLVVFSLDTTGTSRHNSRQRSSFGPPRVLCSEAARPNCKAGGPSGGKQHAVFARFHRTVHQSAMRRPRPLAARRRHRSHQR